MSYVGLVVNDSKIEIPLMKEVQGVSGRSLIDIKKCVNESRSLLIVNTLKSTDSEEVKMFTALLNLFKKEKIDFQLIKSNKQHDVEGKSKGAINISLEDVEKLFDRAKLIESQTQDLVDRDVENEN